MANLTCWDDMANRSESLPHGSPATPPGNRSIFKTLNSLAKALFWFGWDSFWKIFNLDATGDEVKEHSQKLGNRRAGVLITLFIFAYIGGCVGRHFQENALKEMQAKLEEANSTITQLRQLYAGKPTTKSPAELMGLHDQTNMIFTTNVVVSTNQINRFFTVTNEMVFFASAPVLDFFQMEDLKTKFVAAPKIPIKIFLPQGDEKALNLSKQLFQIFVASGFKPENPLPLPNQRQFFPFNGVTVSSKQRPSGKLLEAYMQLWGYLGQPQQYNTDSSMNDTDNWIFVTTIHQ